MAGVQFSCLGVCATALLTPVCPFSHPWPMNRQLLELHALLLSCALFSEESSVPFAPHSSEESVVMSVERALESDRNGLGDQLSTSKLRCRESLHLLCAFSGIQSCPILLQPLDSHHAPPFMGISQQEY